MCSNSAEHGGNSGSGGDGGGGGGGGGDGGGGSWVSGGDGDCGVVVIAEVMVLTTLFSRLLSQRFLHEEHIPSVSSHLVRTSSRH